MEGGGGGGGDGGRQRRDDNSVRVTNLSGESRITCVGLSGVVLGS